MNVALVHDYLNQRGGAERVFRHVADLYPGAPIYTSIFEPAITGDLVAGHPVHTSPLQTLPGSSRYFRLLAPLYPAAFESFDLSAYDLIVSTTTAWAKGVIFAPHAVHVSYIHTVSRFAFDYDAYVGGLTSGSPLRAFAKPVVDRLIAWDLRAAQRPTAFVANSNNVASRVRRYYGREATVAHCPIDVGRFAVGAGAGDYAIVVSRLLSYKRIDLAIEGCRIAGMRLAIVGVGPARGELERAAVGSRTEFLGYVGDDALRSLVGNARVVILPGEEDYGLVPLEAAASGRPTLAYGRGGALETIVPGVTGDYFYEPTGNSVAHALRGFDFDGYDPARMRAHAESFGPEPFKATFASLVDDTLRRVAHGRRA